MQFLAGLPIGAPELLIILAIVVILFGASRLTDIGKGVGRGIREFRKEIKDEDKKEEVEDKEKEAATTGGDDAKS
jgi:sec-independent protein translocase protein TatA